MSQKRPILTPPHVCLSAPGYSQQMKRLSTLDASWSSGSSGSHGSTGSNGLSAAGHPGWLQLHLEACKLLDLCLTLPAHRLPQFQM